MPGLLRSPSRLATLATGNCGVGRCVWGVALDGSLLLGFAGRAARIVAGPWVGGKVSTALAVGLPPAIADNAARWRHKILQVIVDASASG